MQVVRFVLESQRTVDVPGAGLFVNGVLDVPAADDAAVRRTRWLVTPFGGVEYGTVDSATAPPTLPTPSLPPSSDPYPQYLTPNELLDGAGKLLDSKLPSRLSDTELRAALVPRATAQDVVAYGEAVSRAARPAPLTRWRTKLATDAANAKIILMGDSTSDPATDAVQILNRLKTTHTAVGAGLAGMTAANITSVGHNGSKRSDWAGNSTWKTEVTGSGAHLVVYSYGINDIRAGLTSAATLRAGIISDVNFLRSAMPTTDIVLRMPNSFTTDDPEGYGWVTPTNAAQLYSSQLRQVYLSLADYWPDGVAVWDSQGGVFGVVSKTVANSSGLMLNQLHPSAGIGYPAIADALVADLIGTAAVPARPTPATAAVSGYDLVDRADSTTSPGTASSGQAYTVPAGAFGVNTNRLYNPNATTGRAVIDTTISDGEFGATISTMADRATVVFRYASSTDFCYLFNNSGGWQVNKNVGGTVSTVGAVSGAAPASGDRIRLRVRGALVLVYINEVLRGSYAIPTTPGTSFGVQTNEQTPRFTDLFWRSL